MRTYSAAFPAPGHWQEFEDLTVGLARWRLDDPTPQKVGTPGQAQDGLDVLAHARQLGNVGIQCKRRETRNPNNQPSPAARVSLKDVQAAVALVDKGRFAQGLNLFIMASTARADTKLQSDLSALSQARRASGLFRVQVWSWADYEEGLNNDHDFLKSYRAMDLLGRSPEQRDQELLKVIAEAFSRPAFRDPLSCEHPDNFMRAIEDTQRALNLGDLRDREDMPLRRAGAGFRALSDPALLDGMSEVDRRLTAFRASILTAQKEGRVRQSGDWFEISDIELLRDLENNRAAIIQALDAVLARAGERPLGYRASRR